MADIEINLESTNSKELLKSGHHAFIIRDYANAAAALGKATQIMAQEHGDDHDSLGEVYLHYARALLELSRDEAEPLGDAIPHGDEESDSDEQNGEGDENAENEEIENSEKTEESEKKTEETDKMEKEDKIDSVEKKEDETKENDDKTNGTNSEKGIEEASAGPSTSNGVTEESTDANSEKEETEPSDLQLAWEVLEVAKKIFTARGESGRELLSQSLILLGEVGMESENFSDAVDDIQAGLEIQETLYEKTSRKLAETQYKLAMAHGTMSNFDDAIKLYEKSIATLTARIKLLKETNDESSKKEIQEIEELLPEIKEKINDMITVKDERSKVVAEMAEACTKVEKKEAEPASTTKEVKDISHLVKRKRKTEDEPTEAQPAKKPTP